MIRGITFDIDAPVFSATAGASIAGAIDLERTNFGAQWQALVYPGVTLGLNRVTTSLYNGNGVTGLPTLTYNPTTGTTTVTLFFNAAAAAGAATTNSFTEFNSLADGNYTLGLANANLNLLFGGSGSSTVSAATVPFYRAFGDMNGSALPIPVNGADLFFLSDATSNAGSAYRTFLDFDNDGTVVTATPGTSPDVQAFNRRFNRNFVA